MRPGGAYTPTSPASKNDLRPSSNHVVVDGSMGFEDPMETDSSYGGNYGNNSNGGLYSDTLVTNGTNGTNGGSNRRGRGFNRSGRSGR